MRVQFPARLIAMGLIAAAGLMWLSINLNVHVAQAQAATATPRSAFAPGTGVPGTGTPITYTVKSGDSFNAIARQFNLTPQQLQALNAITNTGVIRVGQVLIVGVNIFTPTPDPTDTPTPTAAPTETPTAASTNTPTMTPAIVPTNTPIPADQPAATLAPAAIEPPAVMGAPATTQSIPIDVILVGAVMVFAVVGIIIGFRTQRG